MDEKITIELTKEEHMMVSAILLMHSTGFVVQIHPDRRPLLNKVAEDFSLRNIRIMVGLK